MAARLTPRTRMVFLANPDNPTGTAFSRAELEAYEHEWLALEEKRDALR